MLLNHTSDTVTKYARERWSSGQSADLGSKGPGFDPRAVPKSECMFVNIYHY